MFLTIKTIQRVGSVKHFYLIRIRCSHTIHLVVFGSAVDVLEIVNRFECLCCDINGIKFKCIDCVEHAHIYETSTFYC